MWLWDQFKSWRCITLLFGSWFLVGISSKIYIIFLSPWLGCPLLLCFTKKNFKNILHILDKNGSNWADPASLTSPGRSGWEFCSFYLENFLDENQAGAIRCIWTSKPDTFYPRVFDLVTPEELRIEIWCCWTCIWFLNLILFLNKHQDFILKKFVRSSKM